MGPIFVDRKGHRLRPHESSGKFVGQQFICMKCQGKGPKYAQAKAQVAKYIEPICVDHK